MVEDDGARGIDRRTLIKRGAVVGAVAWTAPVIIESISSPAGAITAPPGCYRIRFTPNDDMCKNSPTNAGTACPPIGTPAQNPITADATVLNCIDESAPCSDDTDEVNFQVIGCDCAFVAASAERVGGSCAGITITGVGPSGVKVTFTKSGAPNWAFFELHMCCGGADPGSASAPGGTEIPVSFAG
jgi:hypothetical protein